MKHREHKIKCDYGLSDYYKHYKKTIQNPVSDKIFKSALIYYLEANNILISQTAYPYKFPQRLGKIELRKSKREVKIDKNGNVVNKLAINWKETLKLWKENKDAKKEKIKMRHMNEHTDGYVFRIAYLKNTANFKNKSVYKMSLNRQMRRSTSEPIINHKIDAYVSY